MVGSWIYVYIISVGPILISVTIKMYTSMELFLFLAN